MNARHPACLTAVSLLAALCCLVVPCLTGCSGPDIEVSREEVVVEGWIAEGQHPIVFVTSTLPISEDEAQLDDLK